MKKGLFFLIAASIIIYVAANNSYGQYSTFYPYSNPTYIDQMLVDNISLRRTEERIVEKRREIRNSPQQGTAPSEDAVPPGINSGSPSTRALFFKPSNTRLMPKELAAKNVQTDKASYEKVFAQALDLFEANAARYNFDYRNIAGVLAMYVDYNYGIYRDGGYLLPAEHKALENDIAAVLLKDNNFLTATDADKQKMYETRAIATVLISMAFEEAKAQKDKNRIKSIRDTAKSNIEKFFGAEIKTIKFTANGIQIKRN